MKPAPFDYVRPRDLDEAVTALSELEWGARVLAGGQSLVPMLNLRLSPVIRLVDISRIAELRGVRDAADHVTFGACVRHGEFEDGKVPDPANGMMRHVASLIAYRAVRNRGTIGGSLSLADPSADWITVVMALGASFIIRGPGGEREVAAADMFLGPYTTALADHDILVGIRIPKLSARARWGYYKIVRKAGEYPTSTTSVVIDRERETCKIVLGAVNRGPLLMGQTAAALHRGGNWSKQTEAALRDAIQRDLASAGRAEDAYEMKLCETTILRAAASALVQ
jgi:aerobic carbon-monoxide dehydrogenase medium subunit